MQFGLWFEPEMVNPDSDLARAHPEWIMAARPEPPLESRHQQVLNLGIPEAYEHVKARLLAVLGEYAIGYLKWDHNRDLIEAGTRTDLGRPGVHAQTLAFYRLLDEIRAAHPGLEIESCSSGGGRVDLGVLERADRIWISDNIDPHDRQRMLRWTSQLVAPEYLGAHIASGRSHVTGRRHDLGFRAATAVFGHLGIEWDLAEATPEEAAELREWIAFYRRRRDLLLDGDIVRLDGYDDRIFGARGRRSKPVPRTVRDGDHGQRHPRSGRTAAVARPRPRTPVPDPPAADRPGPVRADTTALVGRGPRRPGPERSRAGAGRRGMPADPPRPGGPLRGCRRGDSPGRARGRTVASCRHYVQ
nr:hypothetical protein GCM10020092_060270 [Actinoplanes digitatis]